MSIPERAAEKLQQQFPDIEFDIVHFRDEVTVVLTAKDRIVEICNFLRDDPELRFNFLSDLTATDYLGNQPRFSVLYHLYSLEHHQRLRLELRIDEEDPTAPSIANDWPAGEWFEREVFDMFGIRFDGHPDMRRILTPVQVLHEESGEWRPFEGHPLRKDFDIDWEDPDFSFRTFPRNPAAQ